MQKRQKVATGLAAEGVPSCCLDEEQLSRLQAGALCRSRPETHYLIKPTNSRLCLRGLPATASFRRLLPVAYHRALLPGDWYTVRGTLTAGAYQSLQCLTCPAGCQSDAKEWMAGLAAR